MRPRQRLRLTWNSSPNSQGHRDARAAENIVRELAGRIGPIPEGGEVPAIVRRQRWSPINVPLMWAEPSTPVLQWSSASKKLVHCFSDVPQVHFHEGSMNAQEAVQTGWRALRGVFRLWSIEERETSQFGFEVKDSRARDQVTTLLRGPRSLF